MLTVLLQMDCDICCYAFSEEREPKILTRCGHTVCTVCVEALRRSRDARDIECPQCRTIAKPNDVITNFAILSFISSNAPTTVVAVTHCLWHPVNAISVFCVTCGSFICKDCFETSSGVHASHTRISVQDAKAMLINQREVVLSALREEKASNQTVIEMESARQRELEQELLHLRDKAIQHFNLTMQGLHGKLEHVLTRLENYRSEGQVGLIESVSRSRELEQLKLMVSVQDDIGSVAEFARNRNVFSRVVHKFRDCSGVVDDLDRISLDQRAPIDSQRIPVPVMHCIDLTRSELFHLDIPTGEQISTGIPTLGAQPIHRTTSNDRLCS